MSIQSEAVLEIHEFLTKLCIPYAIIGGIAVQYWGEPRFTADVDVTVLIPIGEEEGFFKKAIERFIPRIPNSSEFGIKNRILLLSADNGCPIDLSLGMPGYEEEMLKRTVSYEIVPQHKVVLCSAADLVIHKIIAGRPRDIEDMKGIVFRQRELLDITYIRGWLTEFARLLENPEIVKVFEDAL